MNLNELANTNASLSVYCFIFQTEKTMITSKYFLQIFSIVFEFRYPNIFLAYDVIFSPVTSSFTLMTSLIL